MSNDLKQTLIKYKRILATLAVALMTIVWIAISIAAKKLPVSSFNEYLNDEIVLQTTNHVDIGELTEGIVVKQTFVMSGETLEGIQIKLATFGRNNECSVIAELKDKEADLLIQSWQLDGPDLMDNEIVTLELDEPLHRGVGNKLVLKIYSFNASEGNAVTLWRSSEDYYADGALFINGKKQEGDLWFQLDQRIIDRSPGITRIMLILYLAVGIIIIINSDLWGSFCRYVKKLPSKILFHWEKQPFSLKTCCGLCGILLLFIVIFSVNPFTRYFYIESVDNRQISASLGEIYPGVVIEQSFTAEKKFDGFTLSFSNYKQDVTNDYLIELYSEDDNEKAGEWRVFGSDLENNITMNFDIKEPIQRLPGKYIIKIQAVESAMMDEQPITLWTSEGDDNGEGVLYIDGQLSNTNLAFSVYDKTRNTIAPIVAVLTLIACLGAFLIRKQRLEQVALFLTVGFGLCYMLAFAPFTEPDAEYHYLSAFKLSNVIVGQKDVGNIPDYYYDMDGFKVQYNIDTAFAKVIGAYDKPLEAGIPEYLKITKSNNLTHPAMYLLPALGITFARLTGMNFIWLYYLGRICNLLFFALVVYKTVKTAPKFKCAFLIAAVIPMSLQQASSYSYDTFVNAMALLFAAKVLEYIYMERKLEKRDMLILGLIIVLLAPAKVIYSLLGLLTFAIPPDKYRSKKQYLIWNGVILLLAAGAVGVLEIASVLSVFAREGSYMGKSVYTVGHIFLQPIQTLLVLANTVMQSGWSFLLSMVGESMAGGTVILSDYIPFCFLLLLLLTCVQKQQDHIPFTGMQKMIFAITVSGVTAVVMLIFFLSTPVSQDTIRGIQGRYFLPVLLPALMLTNTDKLVRKIRDYAFISGVILLQIVVMNELLVKIWS